MGWTLDYTRSLDLQDYFSMIRLINEDEQQAARQAQEQQEALMSRFSS